MDDGESGNGLQTRVEELEGQVTAFTGLGEAIKAVDTVLGRTSEELARGRRRTPSLPDPVTHPDAVTRRGVRAVALA